MMLTYALFPRLQTPTMQLVMLQAAAQLLLALAYNIAFFYPPKTGTALCNFQAWAITFSVFLSGFFTALIAFYMVVTIQRKTRFNMSPKRIFAFVAAITLVSGGLAAIPLATDQFADIGARCWIAESEYGRDRRNGVIMRFSTYYGPMWTLIVFIVICYTRLAAYLKNMHNVKTINAQAKFVYRTISVLLMYPGINVIS
jgi:ABC-type Fe3+-siderophore transport system permease subunit